MGEHKIMHTDTGAFYVSVEQGDHPELRGEPLAAGHIEGWGVVAVTSYEACWYGMCSTISSQRTKRLCPQLIFVPGRMDIYKSVSRQVHEIFHEHIDLIEPLLSGKAFLDVTENGQEILLAVDIARTIKQRIREELNLIASMGASYNKSLAKVVSDFRKPDELCTIHPDQAFDFIVRLPIELFWGVGPVTTRKIHLLSIHNGLQLCGCSSEMSVRQSGKVGLLYYDFARGIDLHSVGAVWIHKSIGCEHTLEKDIRVKPAVIIELYHAATELAERSQWRDLRGKMLTLKIKFYDFSQITRNMAQTQELTSPKRILPLAKQLLKEAEYEQHPTRLIGLSASNSREKADEHWGVQEQLNFEFSDWGEQLEIGIRG